MPTLKHLAGTGLALSMAIALGASSAYADAGPATPTPADPLAAPPAAATVKAVPPNTTGNGPRTGSASELPVDDPLAAVEPTSSRRRTPDPRKGTLQDPDYQDAAEMLNPLTPEQIEDLAHRQEQVDQAAISRAPPTSATTSIQVTSRPGVPPSRIFLSDDYVTALSFLDATGAPWPISHAQAGNGKLFKIEVPQEPGNVIIVSPMQKYSASNLIVLLKGAPVPITVSLETTRESAYYNANLVIDDRGPNALAPQFTPPPSPVDDEVMRKILDGAGAITPGVKQMAITGGADTSAYYAGGKFYLRTRYLLQSPAASAAINSGGMRVYELTPSPVITVSDGNGRSLDLILSDEALIEGALSARATLRANTLE